MMRLVPLLAKCKLNDWLCVANAVEQIARKVRAVHARDAAISTAKIGG